MCLLVHALLGVYLFCLVFIWLYCLLQFQLAAFYLRYRSRRKHEALPLMQADFPKVTIHLPVFNEKYVVERLIDNIVRIDYPWAQLQILVLDDSTDETLSLSQQKVETYRAQGIPISLMHRSDRSGYKAGALRDAMPFTTGEYIAIFDADFLPAPDFLLRMLSAFDNPQVGAVQARWGHINRAYSLLTRLQALPLNVHFSIEQAGRYAADVFLQFNGTAGIWRREAIETSGGWQDDTLTEDLDLSYRAQLKGWKIRYEEDYSAPAELPAEMNGLKSQQYRWMKGGAECAVKLLPGIWRAPLPLLTKLNSTGHLLNSLLFPVALILGITSVPVAYWLPVYAIQPPWLDWFQWSMLPLLLLYYIANVQGPAGRAMPYMRRVCQLLTLFPLLMMFTQGLSLHNSVAVVQGLRRRKTPFVRTPKFNVQREASGPNRASAYLSNRLTRTTMGEVVMGTYFLIAVIAGIYLNNWSFAIYHAILTLGFGTVALYSMVHLRR